LAPNRQEKGEVVGIALQAQARPHAFEAVNIYNAGQSGADRNGSASAANLSR